MHPTHRAPTNPSTRATCPTTRALLPTHPTVPRPDTGSPSTQLFPAPTLTPQLSPPAPRPAGRAIAATPH
eukprot:240863-Chlamydomonas_euryale.AAC.2